MHRVVVVFLAPLAALLPVIFDCALKGTLLLALVAIAAVSMRKSSAAARHLAWMLGMIGLLLLPLFSATLPGWRVLPQWAELPVTARTPAQPSPPLSLNLRAPSNKAETIVTELQPGVTASGALAHRALPAGAAAEPSPFIKAFSHRDPALWLGGAWITGAALLLLRLGTSILLLRVRTRAAAAVMDGPLQQALEAACVRLHLRQRVRLFIDDRRIVPLVWGVLRPRLILPAEAREWESSRLCAVLLHELAHVKRRDVLVMLLTQVACAVHWFNPFVWLAAWRLHAERERACDDLVLNSGVRPSDYAGHLLHVASQLETGSPAGALAMARPSRLEGRLMAVLNQQLKRGGVKGSIALLASAIGLSIIIPVAMLRAQEKPAISRDAGAAGGGGGEVIQRSVAAQPPLPGETTFKPTVPAAAEGTVQHTSSAGRWTVGGGVTMEVIQNIYHGADVTSDGVLWWPGREDRPAVRHEFSIATDAFANRQPWKMAWEANTTTLWIAIGEMRFMGKDRDKKQILARIRRLDFSDPTRIVEKHSSAATELPEGIRVAFAEMFDFPRPGTAANEQTLTSPARLERTWVVTGTTRDTSGKTLPGVAIALRLDAEVHPFEQTRSDANGRFLTSIRPPLTALTNGCMLKIRGNRVNGTEPPADFQEQNIEISAQEIARHVGAGQQPAAGAIFEGVVQSHMGKAFPHTLVAVLPDGDAVTGFTARADAEGRFQIPAVPANRAVTVIAEENTWKRRGRAEGVKLVPGETYGAKLTLSPGRGSDWNLVLEQVQRDAPDAANSAPNEKKIPILGDIPLLGRLFRINADASEAIPQEKPQSQHVIEVKAGGSVSFDSTVLPNEALAEKLTALVAINPSPTVTVRAGKDAPYRSVVKVLETCRSTGIANVTIATAPDEEKQVANAASDETKHTPIADGAAEVARARLAQAERELNQISELHHQKLVSAAELDRARTDVEIRKAELAGDTAAVMRTRLEQAERELQRMSELNKEKLVSQIELDRARSEVDIRKAELAGDAAAVMRTRLQQAERELQRAAELGKEKLVSQTEVERARTEVQIRKAELAGDAQGALRARLQQAERELERVSELNKQKLVSQQELERAKFEVELRRAELAGDPVKFRQARLQQAKRELERLIPLYEQKLVSQQELKQAEANVDLRMTEFLGEHATPAKAEKIPAQWQPFSPERVDKALKANQPVFIQFTADWSVDSKATEARVLNTPAVSSAFTAGKVLTLKADWTDNDKVIAEWLSKFGKAGVPLYLLYIPGKAEPHVFPDVLTADDILRELSQIPPSK